MDTVLKVECAGDLRRALLKGTPSYADIDRAVQEIWPGCTADGGKYVDEEGDDCTLKEQTFHDFLETSQKGSTGNVLRLKLQPAPAPEAATVLSPTDAFTKPWERVEQGSEAGEDHPHTVADLTDVHEEDTSAEMRPPATFAPPSRVGQDSGDVVEEALAAVEAVLGKTGEAEHESGEVVEEIGEVVEETGGADDAAQQTAKDVAQDAPGDDKTVPDDGEDPGSRDRVNSWSIHTPPGSPRADLPEKDKGVEYCPAELPAATATSQDQSADPPHGASSSSSCQEAVVIDHDIEEKIDIVLAAFDENGDSHLNFVEFKALHSAAYGGEISEEVFQQMCGDEGEDPELGLGRESLMCIYSRCRTLEGDFEAAKAKLEGLPEEEERARQQRSAPSHPINHLLKNPLLAVPFALDATERLRQGVASTLTGRKR